MRLSEAIRLGATLSEQGFGRRAHNGKRCALGSALEACGYTLVEWSEDDPGGYAFRSFPEHGALDDNFPQLREILALHCPECGITASSVGGVIPHLNDTHRWSREQIADFVELQEPLPVMEEEGVQCS